MMRALWSAATGMIAQELHVDVIANNLANVNTAGYKRQRVNFQDLLYEVLRMPGAPAAAGVEVPTGIQVGLGTRVASTSKLFDQGTFEATSNPLDLVIEGNGFFQILMPDGTIAYTRAGSFSLDSQGNIVAPEGYLLEPNIVVPLETEGISVGVDGTVSAIIGGQPQNLGQIEIAKFANPAGLLSKGHSLYVETAASGTATKGTPGLDGLGTIAQGVLELSNVKVVEEMVKMITAQRAYEANSQAIKIADSMLQIAGNLRA